MSEQENTWEEGEASDEEGEEPSSGHRHHHHQKPFRKSTEVAYQHHRVDREEGEASSDEEMHPGPKPQQGRMAKVDTTQEALESEYRNRITQRQAMRRRQEQHEDKNYSPVRPPPRSKFDSPSPKSVDSQSAQRIGIHKSASLSESCLVSLSFIKQN